MTCDAIRDRLLALPDPRRVPADLRSHFDGCPACVNVQAALVGVEAAVARLSVPDSAPAKAAFLTRLAEPEPIIAHMPTLPNRRGLADLIAGVKWQHAAGLAAGVLIAVGGGWLLTGSNGGQTQEFAAHRHDLLQKEVRHVVRLTGAGTAADRMAVWADVVADLGAEMTAVYQVADEPDLDALAGLFRRAVEDGVVAQARRLPAVVPAGERSKLTETAKKLADAETEANRLLAVARPQAKPVLERMVRTARTGKEALDKLARGEKS